MQQLNVSLTIPIPKDSILIKKVEYEQLKENELTGVYWTMKDLEKRIGKKAAWIKENILFEPRFKKRLDVEQGGFVYYPRNQGEHWSFKAKEMAEFLDKYFSEIFLGGDKNAS